MSAKLSLWKAVNCFSFQVISVPETFQELIKIVKDKFSCTDAPRLFTEDNAEISDINTIRNDEKLYLSLAQDTVDLDEKDIEQNVNDWIYLNVGGIYFMTTRGTLVGVDGNSVLAKMFNNKGSWKNAVDQKGAVMIDRSPHYFKPVLDYLRYGKFFLDKNLSLHGILEEAHYFGLTELEAEIEKKIQDEKTSVYREPLSRSMLLQSLLSTTTKCELRFQGVDFSGADLSRLDLRYVNFKLAVLKNCNLQQTNLSCCSLERTDLSGSNLDGANLQGARMICCIAEGCSMKNCNFDDPSGLRANMEGAIMKGVNFEGSLMAGVNLRVATLKSSNLKNCDLRGAILAGTDLEDCDLSGCDLKEANLRGCNVKGTNFQEMLTPLHMTQSVP